MPSSSLSWNTLPLRSKKHFLFYLSPLGVTISNGEVHTCALPFCGRLRPLRIINLSREEERHLQLLEGVYQMGSGFSREFCTSAHSSR